MKKPRFPLLCLILMLILGWICPLRAVEVTEGPSVVVSGTEATVRWITDVACGTQVKFGRNRHSLNRKVEGGVSTTHGVKLTDLLPGTVYFYTIGTAKKVLQEGSFTSPGAPPAGATPPRAPPLPPKPPVPAVQPEAKPPATPRSAPPSGAPVYTPPPAAQTWGDRWSLQDHFNRHGRDFAARSPEDYAAKAWLFLQRAKDEALPAKRDESDGTIRVWDGKTGSFAAYNRDFTTKTFFKPGSADYFRRQPGKAVRLHHAAAP